jgi:predicted dehydrogenase
VEDSYQLLMPFAGGASFHLDSAWWTLPDSINAFEVVGETARLIVKGNELEVTGERPRIECPPGEGMVTAELRVFIEWLQHNHPAPPGLAEAVAASRLAQDAVNQLRSAPQLSDRRPLTRHPRPAGAAEPQVEEH